MKFKYHRWFQALVVPLVALAFHIFFGYRVIGRENIPGGRLRCLSEPCAVVRPAVCGGHFRRKDTDTADGEKELFRRRYSRG